MTHGASPSSLHEPWLALIPPPQHAFAPPGRLVQPEPPQVPQLRGQLQHIGEKAYEVDTRGMGGEGWGCCRIIPNTWCDDPIFAKPRFMMLSAHTPMLPCTAFI